MPNELSSFEMKAYEVIQNSRFMSHEGISTRLDSPLQAWLGLAVIFFMRMILMCSNYHQAAHIYSKKRKP